MELIHRLWDDGMVKNYSKLLVVLLFYFCMLPSLGCPAAQGCRNPFKVFQGCMRLVALDNQPVDLIKVQQRSLGNYSHLQIDMCGIIDRLVC